MSAMTKQSVSELPDATREAKAVYACIAVVAWIEAEKESPDQYNHWKCVNLLDKAETLARAVIGE